MVERNPEIIADEDFVDFFNKTFYYDKKPAIISIDMQDKFLASMVRNKDFLIRYNKRMSDLCFKNHVNFIVINTENFKFGNNMFGFCEDYEKLDLVTWINKDSKSGLRNVNLAKILRKLGVTSIFVMGIYKSNCVLENLYSSRDDFYIMTSFAGLCTNFKSPLDFLPWKDNNRELKNRILNFCNLVLRQ